jgi:hypothetical protein
LVVSVGAQAEGVAGEPAEPSAAPALGHRRGASVLPPLNLCQASREDCFEGGPARSTLLVSGAETASASLAAVPGAGERVPAPGMLFGLRVLQVRPEDVAERLEVTEQVRVRTVQAGQALRDEVSERLIGVARVLEDLRDGDDPGIAQ